MLIARVMAFALLASVSACGGFDKEKWASGKGKFIGENPREGMFYDAEEAGVKIGAARVTIQGLLGEPDGTWARGDSWHLGRAGYAPDYETLTIVYDKNDIVTDVGVSQP